jgi:hypothetical protein
LALLRPRPPRPGAKPPTLNLFVGLKEFVVPIAVVEDPSTGLWQPVLVGSPDRPIVTVEFLLEVVSILVGDALEL